MAHVRPASDLLESGKIGLGVVGARALIERPEQNVIYALRVGLDVTSEAAERRTPTALVPSVVYSKKTCPASAICTN